jgi:hypothetical protein
MADTRTERGRGDWVSVLDRAIPSGVPTMPQRVEFGLTVKEYYRRKHSRNGAGRGTYWPLHVTMAMPWEAGRTGD